MSINWKDIGGKLAKVGLPILGGAINPALGPVVAGLLGKSEEELVHDIEQGNLSPDQIVILEKYQMDHKVELEKLRQREQERELENIKDSRSMYRINGNTADKIAEKIINENLWMIFGLIAVQIVTMIFVPAKYTTELAIVSNLIGIVIGKLLHERQSVINFFFGSSFGSKLKTVMGGKK